MRKWSFHIILDSHGVALKSLEENIDTATSTGKLIFHIFGALSDFERELAMQLYQFKKYTVDKICER